MEPLDELQLKKGSGTVVSRSASLLVLLCTCTSVYFYFCSRKASKVWCTWHGDIDANLPHFDFVFEFAGGSAACCEERDACTKREQHVSTGPFLLLYQ